MDTNKNQPRLSSRSTHPGSSINSNAWMPEHVRHGTQRNRKSFTLIELLVVLALVAILSVVVVMTLNPAELLKQARDSNRLSDLATINTALNLFSTDVIGGFMGTSTIVYVSLPSTTSNCSNLGLPTLPSGYTYNCVTNQNLRNTDGTGWIPVNFNRISSNSPISQLPIDPTNTTSTRLYYTYTPGGSWELNATVEASKNKLGGSNDLVSKDGGSSPSTYELGNNLNLTPIETGDPSLVGYWNFEEGPNATSTDRSGYGNHGTWYGTSTAEQHYATGKVGNYAGSFNGGSDYVNVGRINYSQYKTLTVSYWINMPVSDIPEHHLIIGNTMSNSSDGFAASYYQNSYSACFYHTWTVVSGTYCYSAVFNQWVNWSFTMDGENVTIYKNGLEVGKFIGQPNRSMDGGYNTIIGRSPISSYYFAQMNIDDVRIYNRALSAAEVLAIYNATK